MAIDTGIGNKTSGDFQMDLSEFAAGIERLQDLTAKQIAAGLREAGTQLLLDSEAIVPRVPHLTGALRASAQLEMGEGGAEVNVGYNVPYAARWHEAENDIDPVTGKHINWSESGVGGKFMEKKMSERMEIYMKICADKIREITG